MLFSIFWGFTAFMLLVWMIVVLFTLIRGNIQNRAWKEILKILLKRVGVVVVIYIALFYIVGYTFTSAHKQKCSADPKDVTVMTPQANIIAKHIVNNGVPKSLADIDKLPYDLKGCKRNEKYQKGYHKLAINEDEADYLEIIEKCQFETEGRKYGVDFSFFEHFKTIDSTHGTLRIRSSTTQTGILYSFDVDKEGNITTDFQEYPVVYSVKSTGICSPMKM